MLYSTDITATIDWTIKAIRSEKKHKLQKKKNILEVKEKEKKQTNQKAHYWHNNSKLQPNSTKYTVWNEKKGTWNKVTLSTNYQELS